MFVTVYTGSVLIQAHYQLTSLILSATTSRARELLPLTEVWVKYNENAPAHDIQQLV